MDPEACLRRVVRAINDNDFEEAGYALDDYRQWRARGGFEPAGGDGLYHALVQSLRARRSEKGVKS